MDFVFPQKLLVCLLSICISQQNSIHQELPGLPLALTYKVQVKLNRSFAEKACFLQIDKKSVTIIHKVCWIQRCDLLTHI